MFFLASTDAADHGQAADQVAAGVDHAAEAVHHAAGHAAEHSDKLDTMGHILNRDYWELTHALKWNVADLIPIPVINIGSFQLDLKPSLHVFMLWLAAILLTLLITRAAKRDIPWRLFFSWEVMRLFRV